MNILIVNQPEIQVTEAIRALKRDGKHNISIAIPQKNNAFKYRIKPFFLSKYLDYNFNVSSPYDLEKFCNDICRILTKHKYDLVLPFGFETTCAISKLKKKINQFAKVFVADFDQLISLHDKKTLNNLLSNKGISVPKIYDYKNIDEIFLKSINFPVVIKARRGSGIEKGVRYAKNFKELKAAYHDISGNITKNADLADFSYPLVQEYIPGEIYDGLYLCENGTIKSEMLQIRKITYPLSGGVGVNNITLEDKNLSIYCREILKIIKWHGPCQIEVKKDDRDKKYKLIEINPKLWGTLGLSIKAGISFPEDICDLVSGKFQPKNKYKLNLKYKILFPLEFFTIFQDKGNRLKRFMKLFEVFKSNVVTEIDIRDLKPNILYFLYTFYILIFNRKKILPIGKKYP